MENENAIIKLTEELVSSKDNYASLIDDYARLKERYYNVSEKLERLIKAIINNTQLDYYNNLEINDDTDIIQLVKCFDPDKYMARREVLTKKETEESKEANENGK